MNKLFLCLMLAGCVLSDAKTVRFHWTTKYKQSMFFGEGCTDTMFLKHCKNSYMAYQREGILFYRNTSLNTGEIGIEQRVPEGANVLVADGFYRSAPTVNGQVPGPTIEVEEGDTVVVTLVNEMENEAVTLHWHGMYQRGTPYMDGVSQVTQCAVLPSETFEYQFVAEPAGTHSWHAHHGVQRPDGLFGPLIVHPKGGPSKTRRAVLESEDCENEEVMMLTIQDHESSQTTYNQHDGGAGWYPDGPEALPTVWTRDVSGKLVNENPFRTGLINGKGRFHDITGDNGGSSGASSTNLTEYRVESIGDVLGFRIVSSQESLALRVSVDRHELTAFASDGAEFESVAVESVIVHPGETFDFAIRATDTGRFWVRAETLEVDAGGVDSLGHTALAILIVGGDNDDDDELQVDPITERRPCTADDPCVVLNCPFPAWPPASHTQCLQLHELRATEEEAAAHPPPSGGPPDIQMFLNFVYEPAINNRRFVFPEAPPLTQPDSSGSVPCDDAECDYSAFPGQPCECTHTKELPFNATVELVLTNLGGSGFGLHSMHLHGHSFWVHAIGYPPHDSESGRVCVFYEGDDHPTCFERDDVACVEGTGCGVAEWKNASMMPFMMNYDRPPRKDTVVVPPGGWTVVRFVTDNPGLWHLHCHMAHHLESGMGMLLNEAPDLQARFPPPPGFPTCGSLNSGKGLDDHVARAREEWLSLGA